MYSKRIKRRRAKERIGAPSSDSCEEEEGETDTKRKVLAPAAKAWPNPLPGFDKIAKHHQPSIQCCTPVATVGTQGGK